MGVKIKKEWEKRSLNFADSLGGVMPASFPDSINNLFHNWELAFLRKFFPKSKKIVNVLDLGCGYGRHSHPLSQVFKNTYFFGIDISQNYVNIFNRKLKKKGRAVLADVKTFPFKAQKFDFIIMVGVLTYLTDREIKSLIRKIKKIAQNDATVLVIENNISGINYLTGFSLFTKLKKIMGCENQFIIKAKNFKDKEIEDYFKGGFFLHGKTKCRLLTLLSPFLFLATRFKLAAPKDIKPDINLPFLPTLSIAYAFKIKTD